MQRAEISLPSVTARLDSDRPEVGIVDINLIAASTADEILQAVEALQSRGAVFFVIDLRDNPGGLLTAGVEIARLFLKDGAVIEQQYRGQEVESLAVNQPGPLSEIPLVVLINPDSASAAEIIAGAIQAHQRALLAGLPSRGKDTIQLVFELEDGSSLHVTAAHWWVPGLSQPVGGQGLQPDLLTNPGADPAGRDETLQEAIRVLLEGN
jgi:carboxyl-terminal processing protease